MSLYTQKHLTASVVMIQPVDFGYNEQTGLDNTFQHQPKLSNSQQIKSGALAEFDTMTSVLRKNEIEVIILGKTHTEKILPDAVFPNNWFSTRQDGKLFIYPMKTLNRQAEVQVTELSNAFNKAGYQVKQIIDLRNNTSHQAILEGTGSLIFHHSSGQVFTSLSERCWPNKVLSFCKKYNYQAVTFESFCQKRSIYHTNVMMSCGENFAVITPKVLSNNEQNSRVIKTLGNTVNDLILISEQQMKEHFCGNIIQLKNKHNDPFIVMSKTAYNGFTGSQKKCLEKHGHLLVCKIPTIEYIGGGSARCMIAENFLPTVNQSH